MQLYGMRLYRETFDQTDEALLPFVSEKRREKIKRCRFASDRKRSLYAALLARKVLAEHTGIANADLCFSYSAHHAPVCENAPSVSCNISHTRGFLLCGVASAADRDAAPPLVGVDVERIRTAPFSVMRRVFSAEEIAYVSTPSFSDARFFEIWTKKEAYTKACGDGLAIGHLSAVNTLAANLATGFHLFFPENYCCCIYGTEPLTEPLILCREEDVRAYYTKTP